MMFRSALKRTIAWTPVPLLALLLAACAATQNAGPPPGAAVAEEDDHAHAGDYAVLPAEGEPYDAAFIDAMVAHHRGAIVMANQALEQAERPAIRELAAAIIAAQEAEIGQMDAWRSSWYPGLPLTSAATMDMGPMEVPAGDAPFDQRFIQAMVPHHAAAISMARGALQNAEHQELKRIAVDIISAQENEIGQMRVWLKEWYGLDL